MKHKSVTFTGSASSPDQFPRDGLPEVAFLGRSNVGKSSLLNALAGTRGLALVSSAPGRTRVVNFFRVTGTRQLRLKSLAWDSASQPSRARGEAQLTASYTDRAERIDRVVKVDIAIAWRDGRPRIARLSLFPRESGGPWRPPQR